MSTTAVYALGVVTLPALWLMLIVLNKLLYRPYWWMRRNVGFVYWLPKRTYRRWEWSESGRALSFTVRRWPRRGFAVTLRPWRPYGAPLVKRPSMADDIRRVRV